MSGTEARQCFSALLESMLPALEPALHTFDKDHDYLRILGEAGHATCAIVEAPHYLQACQQYAHQRHQDKLGAAGYEVGPGCSIPGAAACTVVWERPPGCAPSCSPCSGLHGPAHSNS